MHRTARLVLAALALATVHDRREVEERPLVTYCFAPDTPADVRARWEARGDDGGKAFTASDSSRWSRTATDGFRSGQGVPITLTWGVVPDGTPVPASFGAPASVSDVRSWLDARYGSEAAWRPILQSVFDRWGQLTGVSYVFEPNDDAVTLNSAQGVVGLRPDIRIAGRAIDGNAGVLAYNAFPNDGDMVLDTSDGFFAVTSSNSRRLRNVVAHEHGHGLGLDHVCPLDGSKLMEPSASTAFDGPQHDDVRGAQRLYGDGLEPNDGTSSATDLGAPGTRRVVVESVSIDDDTDQDLFAFTAPEGSYADVTLTPLGAVYREGEQLGDGGCGATVNLDTRDDADLRLALLDADGAVIASVDSAGRGGEESLVDVALPATGVTTRYHVRVRNGGEDAVQLYRLTLRLAQRGEKPVAGDDAASTFEVLPVDVSVLDNDDGLADVPLDLRVVALPASGQALVTETGIVYVPNRGFAGQDVFTYRVSDVHGQSDDAVVTVDVTASARAGAARDDTDLDGYPDEFEEWRGTSIDDAEDRPAEELTNGSRALVVASLTLKLDARRTLTDAATLRADVEVPEGFEPTGTTVLVSLGGVARAFTLDERGRSVDDGSDRVRLRLRRKGGVIVAGPTRLDVRVRKGDLSARLADEGLALGRRQRKEPRAITAIVVLGARTHAADVPLVWTAKAGKSGKARSVR